METEILGLLARKNYVPLKPKAMARKLGLSQSQYAAFRKALKALLSQGRAELGRNHTVRPSRPHGTVVGIYRRTSSGLGFVRPHPVDGKPGPDVAVREDRALDAATGDEVLVRVLRKPSRGGNGTGEVLRVLERATRQFVGAYFERDGLGYVRIDGTVFANSVLVGDPGAKGAKPDDKVVIEMLRFPTAEERGEGVITEVLGPRGAPGVDTLSIIREFGMPDAFPPEVLKEAREQAEQFDERDLDGREDFTKDLVITIDPADARDFDDAVSLERDEKGWRLTVHIADVGHFAPPGGALDAEARKRGNSVYLPQRVLPMFPEVISNGLASLQQGKLRYVKSVVVDFAPDGKPTAVRFANGAIRVRQRFAYEQVSALLDHLTPRPPSLRGKGEHRASAPDGEASSRDPEVLSPPSLGGKGAGGLGETTPEVRDLLLRMRELAMTLRKRRFRRGALELVMPETDLEYDDQGRVTGAHFAVHDVSHQIIEEFMLAANEAVAQHFAKLGVAFLRRVHPAPEPTKLQAFAEFARMLGYTIDRHQDRFALQRILRQTGDRPDAAAVNYALLRSLKQAVYSPDEEEHYALASANYCHFTSPIRRYPDLVVHRLLDRWLRTKRAGSDEAELVALGEHCSKTERRADLAERELIKVKLLTYLSDRIGERFEAVITGVSDYGFFAQGVKLPVEGLVHVSTLADDYYFYDESSHTLEGKRGRRRFRLGDTVTVEVVRVDLTRRQLDFRLVEKPVRHERRRR
jgi:ribonuclease R